MTQFALTCLLTSFSFNKDVEMLINKVFSVHI